MFNPSDYPDVSKHPRMQREAKTVSNMIDIYCSTKHGTKRDELCAACSELRDYSMLRLSKCPFQEGKTSCGKCRVHCYKPDMRARAKDMMRIAGPRMAYRHPYQTFRHFLDERRKEPTK
jgi:hypothetical protein